MSLRPLSAMARRTLRPMRPNPLMATRTVIKSLPVVQIVMAATGHAEYRSLSLLPKFAQCRVGHPLRRNAEMLVEFLIWRTGAEARHADENPVAADNGVPTLPHGGFDPDIHFGVADDGAPRRLGLCEEKLEAGHG